MSRHTDSVPGHEPAPASLAKMIDNPVRVDTREVGKRGDEQNASDEQIASLPSLPSLPSEPSTPNKTLLVDKIRGAVRMVLIRFCEQFELAMAPITEPMEQTIGAIENIHEQDQSSVGGLLPDVRELGHQIETLRDRVRKQHAYVLIFGPLKSGKSTFMNAMSGSYVSEVTALPAYPCMVYVMHAEKPDFRITNYAGDVTCYTDRDEVIQLIDEAHRALTQRSRQVESEGGRFDPMTDMPQAIRRIDVRVPAADLAPSGAVLVDTPGLYSRMKFGYDQMTRNFRNSAACAVFIVKTDNLFLEQVFSEFQELLDLFSRIFLIVNLDASKQDLRPDGSLAPSLEHADPQRIIEAFETLAMSAQLKTAADDGRLQIYPVNLLGAASRRICANQEQGAQTAEDKTQDFETLLNDLTEYLNSNEYVRAFMDDSIRRAEAFIDELRTLDSHASMDRLASERAAIRSELDRARAGEEALRRLSGVNWLPTMQPMRESLVGTMRERVHKSDQQIPDVMRQKIEHWFNHEVGLQSLERDELEPILTETRRDWLGALDQELDRSLRDAGPGAWLSSQRRSDFSATGLDATAVAREAINRIDTHSALAMAPAIFNVEQLPIQRSFWDLLLLRTRRRLRRQLFGIRNENHPPHPHPPHPPYTTPVSPTPPASQSPMIPVVIKQKRLGAPAKQVMIEQSQAVYELLRADALDRLPRFGFERFSETFKTVVDQRLEERRQALAQAAEHLHTRLGKIDAVVNAIKALGQVGRPVVESLGTVRTQFCQHDVGASSG